LSSKDSSSSAWTAETSRSRFNALSSADIKGDGKAKRKKSQIKPLRDRHPDVRQRTRAVISA
jgi:hypothetical protein